MSNYSAAAYKQFTEAFFRDIKVVRYPNICELIIASRKRMEKKGLRFDWLNFRTIASGIQEIYNAMRCNDFAKNVANLFIATPHPSPSPH